MGLVDTAMLGRYSDTALAGAGIANALLFVVTVFGIGVLLGLDTLIPQAIGAGESKKPERLLSAGLRLGVLLGMPLTVLVAAMPLTLPLMSVSADIAEETTVYVLGRLLAVVPFLLFTAARSYLQAHGVTRPIVAAVVIGNVINLLADAVLIYGDATLEYVGIPTIGLPALGVLGAAASTTIVTWLTLGVLLLAVRARAGRRTARARPDPAMQRSILRVGLPVGLHLVAEVGVFSLAAVLAGVLGKVPAAAHQVAITLASFTFSVVIGVGASTSVRVGQAVGAGDIAATRHAGFVGIGLGAAVMSCSAVVFLVATRPLAQLFTDDPAVIAAAVPLLRIAALFQISDGIQAVAAGALRGAGDTASTFVANLVGHYAIGLVVAVTLAFGFDLGAPGLWWGLSAGLTATAAALVARFWWLSARPISPS